MKYKNVAITALVILIIGILIVGYFCFASLSASYGYQKSWIENSSCLNENSTQPLTVILDAGHGGIDPGAICGSLIEKDLNLKVANKLKDCLSISGVTVVMTRTEDVLLGSGDTVRAHKTADLKERLRILEQTENCIFVSVHMNKFSSSSVHGLQTFYASNNENSSKLAQCIQDKAKIIDSTNKRDIKPDDKNIYILEKATKPAVLVECGFISNETDAKMLSDEEYQNKLAFAMYLGIMKYIQENET